MGKKKNKRRPRQVAALFVSPVDVATACTIMTGRTPDSDTPQVPNTSAVELDAKARERQISSLVSMLRQQLPNMLDSELNALAEELLENVLAGIAHRQSS